MKKVIVEFKGDWSDENIYDFFHHIAYQTELGE